MDQSVFCPHCGAALRSTAKFCSKCGKPVVQSARPEQPVTPAQAPSPPPQQAGWGDLPATEAAPPDFMPIGEPPPPAAVHIPQTPLPPLEETDEFDLGEAPRGERKSLLRQPLFWVGCIGLLVVLCCLVGAVIAYTQLDGLLDYGGDVEDIFNTIVPEIENIATEMPDFEQFSTEIPEGDVLPSIIPEIEKLATDLPSLEDFLPTP